MTRRSAGSGELTTSMLQSKIPELCARAAMSRGTEMSWTIYLRSTKKAHARAQLTTTMSEKLESDSPLDATACSLLEWTPNPENPREILGRSKRTPGITLYIIKLMDSRDDRGQMHGAFISDELEREGLYDKALVHWLKREAESQMREFMELHTANAKCAATGSERNAHE